MHPLPAENKRSVFLFTFSKDGSQTALTNCVIKLNAIFVVEREVFYLTALSKANVILV